MSRGRILIVDDDRSMCEMLDEALSGGGFQAVVKTAAQDAFRLLDSEDFDAVVTDLNMRGMNGIELCERVSANRPDVPVIVITGFGSLETAIGAIRAGAYDFIVKPFEIEALFVAIDRAVRFHTLQEEVKRLREEAAGARQFEEIVGDSDPMRCLYEMMASVGASDSSVLIVGETGTGKELVARALHRGSPRSSGPFVAINCAAMPEALLESELFGHVRGAFTDAKSSRTGLLVRASGGTLLLDEIGDMSLGLQPKLLRALEERRVRPVGSDTEVSFDVRIIAATHRDIDAAVKAGQFREDLFFRLNVILMELPPLRARGNDILLLAQHFIRHFAGRSGKKVLGLSSGAAEKLFSYSWPGNVRELQNCIERAVALTRYEQLTVEDLPEKIRNYSRARVPLVSDALLDDHPSELLPMEEIEKRYILRVLEAVGSNKTMAAQILGFDRKTLYRKLERYAIERGDTSGEEPEAR